MSFQIAAITAVSVLALGTVSCSPANTSAPAVQPPATQPAATQPAQAPGEASPAPATQTSPASAPDQAEERNAAALRAIATAEGAADGIAYEIDDEDDDSTWEVDVMVDDRSVEVKVSGDGNTVISQEDDDDADDADRARLDRAQISLTQAIEAALQEVPGFLDDAELDDEDGRDAWEVSIDASGADDTEVYVSPQDGSIIRVDR